MDSPIDKIFSYQSFTLAKLRGWQTVYNNKAEKMYGGRVAGFLYNPKDLASQAGYRPLRQVKDPGRFALVATQVRAGQTSTRLYLSIWALSFQAVAGRFGFFLIATEATPIYGCAQCAFTLARSSSSLADIERHYQNHLTAPKLKHKRAK